MVTLYTTHCPRCKMIEMRLQQKGIEYTENTNIDEMIEMGLEQEVKSLVSKGITKENQSVTSIGYREWFDYFEGKTDKKTTIDLIKQHTRNYCKRQLTFLKTVPNITLCELDEAREIINKFLNNN